MTTNVEDMRELPDALLDRFPVRIRINEPHPNALSLLSEDLRGIASRLADAGSQRVSLRSFFAFDKLRSSLGLEEASVIIFGDRAESIRDAIRIESVG